MALWATLLVRAAATVRGTQSCAASELLLGRLSNGSAYGGAGLLVWAREGKGNQRGDATSARNCWDMYYGSFSAREKAIRRATLLMTIAKTRTRVAAWT
eukprot:scaffold1983_cov376-Prasinococcus_capsulatus_cf.AAC.8